MLAPNKFGNLIYKAMKFRFAIVPLCLISIQALAFEGIIKQQVKNYNGSGTTMTMTWSLAAQKCRLDVAVSAKDISSSTVMIADPSTGVLKTYNAGAAGSQKFFFQVNSSDITSDLSIISVNPTADLRQILGYKCEKWVVITSKGNYTIWISKDIDFDCGLYKDFFKSSPEIQALASQHIKGFPMLSESSTGVNGSSTTDVSTKAVDAGSFTIPSDYKLFSAASK